MCPDEPRTCQPSRSKFLHSPTISRCIPLSRRPKTPPFRGKKRSSGGALGKIGHLDTFLLDKAACLGYITDWFLAQENGEKGVSFLTRCSSMNGLDVFVSGFLEDLGCGQEPRPWRGWHSRRGCGATASDSLLSVKEITDVRWWER